MGFLANIGNSIGGWMAGPQSAEAAARSSMGWGAAATGAATAGALLQGVGQFQQSQHAAKVMGQNAAQARLEGQVAESALKGKTTAAVESAKAEQAANGVEVSSKSAEAVRGAIAQQGALDAALLHYKAQSEAFADQAQAALYKKAGTGALVRGVANADATFLSGASSLADKWSAYKRGIGGY